jgi:hypothetical protein
LSGGEQVGLIMDIEEEYRKQERVYEKLNVEKICSRMNGIIRK